MNKNPPTETPTIKGMPVTTDPDDDDDDETGDWVGLLVGELVGGNTTTSAEVEPREVVFTLAVTLAPTYTDAIFKVRVKLPDENAAASWLFKDTYSLCASAAAELDCGMGSAISVLADTDWVAVAPLPSRRPTCAPLVDTELRVRRTLLHPMYDTYVMLISRETAVAIMIASWLLESLFNAPQPPGTCMFTPCVKLRIGLVCRVGATVGTALINEGDGGADNRRDGVVLGRAEGFKVVTMDGVNEGYIVGMLLGDDDEEVVGTTEGAKLGL